MQYDTRRKGTCRRWDRDAEGAKKVSFSAKKNYRVRNCDESSDGSKPRGGRPVEA